MYAFILLIVIAALIAYGALFTRYWEAVSYYGEQPIGFHKWIKKFFKDLWDRNKL